MADKNQFYEDMLDKAIEYAGKEIEDDFYAQFSDEFADEEVDLPEDFDQKMKAMFAEAHAEEKKELRKKLRPRRIRNIAATIIVTICVGSACIMSVDAWRIKIFNIVFEITESMSSMNYKNPDSDIMLTGQIADKSPEYMPDGYVVDEQQEVGTKSVVIYKNNTGDMILLEFSTASASTFNVYSEHDEKIDINGMVGFYMSQSNTNTLIWDYNGCVFRLSGKIEQDEMKRIAQSIKF